MITETLYPNGTEYGGWAATPPTANDHENIDEDPPKDTDYIFGASGDVTVVTFPAPASTSGEILYLRARVRGLRNIWRIASTVHIYLFTHAFSHPTIPSDSVMLPVDLPQFTAADFDLIFGLSPTGSQWTFGEVGTIRMLFQSYSGSCRLTQAHLEVAASVQPIYDDSIVVKAMERDSETRKTTGVSSVVIKAMERDAVVGKLDEDPSVVVKALERDSVVARELDDVSLPILAESIAAKILARDSMVRKRCTAASVVVKSAEQDSSVGKALETSSVAVKTMDRETTLGGNET